MTKQQIDERKPLDELAPIPEERPEQDPDVGQGHEEIELDEWDTEFSRNYWKLCRQENPEAPETSEEPEQDGALERGEEPEQDGEERR